VCNLPLDMLPSNVVCNERGAQRGLVDTARLVVSSPGIDEGNRTWQTTSFLSGTQISRDGDRLRG